MTHEMTIEQRLATLPQKLSTPFRQLLTKGLISEQALSSVLDAGKLADDYSRLLGFTIAYCHMEAKNVPVGDTIRMAKSQGRAVKLDWSVKRWKTEHNLLSRMEALVRLSKNNVEYDVSRYEALLPEQFSGYIIKSSQRLGMEGLRQRHCVASYHDQIQSGRCAIVTMLVAKQRWTVELFATGNSQMPLRVGQIKTRLNRSPTHETREKIHNLLGINMAESSHVSVETGSTYMDTLRRLLPILRDQNVTTIIVGFEGYGDSGSIETIDYFPCENASVQDYPVQYRHIISIFDNGWVNQLQEVEGFVNGAIESLSYDYLNETDVDWYTNEGGFGKLIIDVEAGTVSLDVDVRFPDSNTEFSSKRDIITGEEI